MSHKRSSWYNGQGYFDPHKEIDKYDLDESTFDLINIENFRNRDKSTVFAYIYTWVMIILSLVLLGTDIYTCLNILVFHRWSTKDFQPYAYSVAKWIFTGCIIFQFVLLAYHWLRAIHTYRTKNIALTYVNTIARLLYIIKSYNYHCLFHQIEQDNFFDWTCFLCYTELDGAVRLLIADTPRQVINILTLRYYATDRGKLNDIIGNIRTIATTNLRLSIILSFMCLSVAIWSIFFFKFLFGIVFYIPVMVKLRDRGYKSLKKYCCDVVNENVRILVRKNHKSKRTLLETGVLDLKDIAANPLLSLSTTTLEDFDFRTLPLGKEKRKDISKPPATHRIIPQYRYDDSYHSDGGASANSTYESLPLDDMKPEFSYSYTKPRTPKSFIPTSHMNESSNSLNPSLHNAQTRNYTNPYNRRFMSDRSNTSENISNPFEDKASRVYDPASEPTYMNYSRNSSRLSLVKKDEDETEVKDLSRVSSSVSLTYSNPFEQESLDKPKSVGADAPPYPIKSLAADEPPYPIRSVSVYDPSISEYNTLEPTRSSSSLTDLHTEFDTLADHSTHHYHEN